MLDVPACDVALDAPRLTATVDGVALPDSASAIGGVVLAGILIGSAALFSPSTFATLSLPAHRVEQHANDEVPDAQTPRIARVRITEQGDQPTGTGSVAART
ncbi:hypothetical protein [Halorubellus litoreus]|uniref:Uncharacterized protein n=1 Tax=Halorubellus litoreus TaxID=755308 RepID=A0ABD5VGY6_9EURY